MPRQDGWYWAQIACSLALFGLSVWAAWPMLTFQNFPHIGLREYSATLLVIVAGALAPRRKRNA